MAFHFKPLNYHPFKVILYINNACFFFGDLHLLLSSIDAWQIRQQQSAVYTLLHNNTVLIRVQLA